jgi:hypothetical protein
LKYLSLVEGRSGLKWECRDGSEVSQNSEDSFLPTELVDDSCAFFLKIASINIKRETRANHYYRDTPENFHLVEAENLLLH